MDRLAPLLVPGGLPGARMTSPQALLACFEAPPRDVVWTAGNIVLVVVTSLLSLACIVYFLKQPCENMKYYCGCVPYPEEAIARYPDEPPSALVSGEQATNPYINRLPLIR